MAIRVNLNLFEGKNAFPYHRSTVTYNNIYWSKLYSNLRKAQRIWGLVAKVLGKIGETIKARAMM